MCSGPGGTVQCIVGWVRVGVCLWMAWVDGTMLPALSLWHFHIERRSWKEERNEPTSSSCPPRLVQKVAREASIRMCACHCECLSCYGFSLLINAWFQPRRSGTLWLVSLNAFWSFLMPCLLINYIKGYIRAFYTFIYFKCVWLRRYVYKSVLDVLEN